jgi:hypothetical protein
MTLLLPIFECILRRHPRPSIHALLTGMVDFFFSPSLRYWVGQALDGMDEISQKGK